ncbi:MAG: hypothetical protein CL605_02345 [Altibacter sp.]|nr:hypothetical protein [Altibacter sp.]|tara:strand:+ start:11418 stop:11645 length:228 start_codon:yes stop_codon:yes gene_type:complete
MNRFEKAVTRFLEKKGPSSTHEIQYNLKDKYYIGSIKSVGTKLHASQHFRKVNTVILTGQNGSYSVAVWEVKKHE